MAESPFSQSNNAKIIGTYQVIKELGCNREGGRITYLGTHAEREQKVVLKYFRFIQSDTSWSGFKSHEREIKILQSIQHPQVPQYVDSFETPDGFCMVQEYKEAPSLAERYHLTPIQIHTVGVNLLQVLADLQQQVPPIIHRDIKPENILVDDRLQVYLIDFGLAKLNHDAIALSSVAAGTPGFMPPEEVFNRPLGTTADLYSVGATLIALLTGKKSVEISELIDETYRFDFVDCLPAINPLMTQWLAKMVEPNPKDRYIDAAAALSALKQIDITDFSTRFTPHNLTDSKKNSARNLVVGLLLLLGTSIIGLEYLASDIEPIRETASQQPNLSQEEQWFTAIKPRCNALEVVTAIQNAPFPNTPGGAGFGASCYAIAGKLQQAEEAILSVPPASQKYAASILFQIGHPVADRGDDESAGPIMDLVLEYWPENYMALYHAGMSAYVLEEHEKAIGHLEAFLEIYQRDDGWTNKAKLALENIEQGIAADERFKVHH